MEVCLTFPVNLWCFRVLVSLLSRDQKLPPETWNQSGLQENFFFFWKSIFNVRLTQRWSSKNSCRVAHAGSHRNTSHAHPCGSCFTKHFSAYLSPSHHSVSSPPQTTLRSTTADWNRECLLCPFAGREGSLIIWLKHFLTQVMVQNPASTLTVSSRRSITPSRKTASTSRMTLPPQSQPPRTSTVFISKRQPAVARSTHQQVRYTCGLATCGPALGNWCEVVRQFQVLKGLFRKEKTSRSGMLHKFCLKGKIYMSTSSRKVKWLPEEDAQLRDDYLRLQQTNWERRNYDMALENSKLKDWNCTKRISGQIRLGGGEIVLCGELEMNH